MIRVGRPATLECDRCHRCWITHPAGLSHHPTITKIRPPQVEHWARAHGWTTTETGHLCPRCCRR